MAVDRLDPEAVFHAARHLPADRRAAYLDGACAADPAVRPRVERLLAAEPEVGSFLEAPAPELDAARDSPGATDRPGTVVGPYKLLEPIGEGAFGVVFMAEQSAPVRRKVALKVLKAGMDTRQVVARFEAERQAIARADPDDFPFEAGVDYHLSATVVGNNLELKAWKVGEPEPDKPMLTIKDRTFGPKAGSGIGAIAFFDPVPLAQAGVTEVQVSATVDDITFTPGR